VNDIRRQSKTPYSAEAAAMFIEKKEASWE
jgi:hypothetical protein